MMAFYRILSFVVNLISAVIAMITLISVMYAFANPAALFQVFLFGCTVLYAWFANRFFVRVIRMQQTMTRRQKDWLQVNAIVAFIFSLVGIANSIYIFINPAILDELIKALPAAPPKEMDIKKLLTNFSIGLLVSCILLLIHITWTYMLIRKHKASFEG